MSDQNQNSISRLQPLLHLLPRFRNNLKLLFAWIFFLALSSAATLALPIGVRKVIERAIGNNAIAQVDQAFLGLAVVALLLALATALRYYFVSLLGERVSVDLRRQVYDHVLTLDQTYFERTRTGDILSRITSDVDLVQNVIGSSLSVALRSGLIIIGAAIALILTSPKLAGITAIVIPAIIIPIVFFGQRVRKLSRSNQDRVADATSLANETLGAMQVVQAFVRERLESSRFESMMQNVLQAAKKRIRTRAMLTAFVIVMFFGGITLALWGGTRMVLDGAIGFGVLSQFVLYALIAAGSFGALTEVWGEVQRANGAMERIDELLRERALITSPQEPQTFTLPIRGAVHFDAVQFHYPTRPNHAALNQFSLDIHAGETIALVGPSGAGKSTVFQLLLRFYDPQFGQIKLDGVPLLKLPLELLRGAIALVPQHGVMFAATVAENIGVGREGATRAEIEAAAKLASADEFIVNLPERYDTHLGERGMRLSGGQQQRIAIARAVLKNAPILLLDEATSALDAQSEAAIQIALEKLKQGRTTLVIAHRLATVLKADRIVVLNNGGIEAIGTHQELLQNSALYAELARLQFDQAYERAE